MNKKEKRAFSSNAVRIERDNIVTDGDVLRIKGYCCHFGKPNGNGEIVNKDSFDRWFNELKPTDVMPSINLMHTDRIIGGIDVLRPDDTGLWMEGRICLTPFVRDEIMPLIDNGFLVHLSTQGWVTRWHEQLDEDTDRYYFVADEYLLMGVALVDVPADLNAKFSSNAVTLERFGKEKKEEKSDKRRIDLI